MLIDHIFTRGFNGSTDVARVLDETIELDVDGTETPAALSDYYGLLMTVTADS